MGATSDKLTYLLDTKRQINNAKTAAHDMGDHIKNLFPMGVVRQCAISQFCALHISPSFQYEPPNGPFAHLAALIIS